MKNRIWLLFILSFLTYQFSIAQINLRGEYRTPGGFSGYGLTFKNDSMFEYSYWSCMNNDSLKGTYKIVNKKLFLHFNGADMIKNLVDIKSIKCVSYEDSVTFYILMQDKINNETLPFANVYINDISDKVLKTTTSNMEGKAVLKIKKSKKSFFINANYVGYKRVSQKISATECKEIKFDLVIAKNGVFTGIDYDKTWEYKIKKVKKGNLILQQKGYKEILTNRKTN